MSRYESFITIRDNNLLSPKRWEIYNFIHHAGRVSSLQIISRLRQEQFPNTVRTRLNELVKLGCVKKVGHVLCEVTKRQVLLFDCTDQLPVHSEKLKSKTKIIRELEFRVMDAEKAMATCWQLTGLIKGTESFGHELSKYRKKYPDVLKHAVIKG